MKSIYVLCVAALLSCASAFAPSPSFGPSLHGKLSNTQIGYKVVSSIGTLKKRPGCQVVKRRGRVYVINKENPKFKVRQGGAKMKKNRRGNKRNLKNVRN